MSHRLERHQYNGVVTVHGFRTTGSGLQCKGKGKGKGRFLIYRSLRDDRTSELYNLGSGS